MSFEWEIGVVAWGCVKRVICVQCPRVGSSVVWIFCVFPQRVTTGISDNLKKSGKSIDADQSKITIKGKPLQTNWMSRWITICCVRWRHFCCVVTLEFIWFQSMRKMDSLKTLWIRCLAANSPALSCVSSAKRYVVVWALLGKLVESVAKLPVTLHLMKLPVYVGISDCSRKLCCAWGNVACVEATHATWSMKVLSYWKCCLI